MRFMHATGRAPAYIEYNATRPPSQPAVLLPVRYLARLQKSLGPSAYRWPPGLLRADVGSSRRSPYTRSQRWRRDPKLVISRVYCDGDLVSNRSTTPPNGKLPGNVVFGMGNLGIMLTSMSFVHVAETTRSNISSMRMRLSASAWRRDFREVGLMKSRRSSPQQRHDVGLTLSNLARSGWTTLGQATSR